MRSWWVRADGVGRRPADAANGTSLGSEPGSAIGGRGPAVVAGECDGAEAPVATPRSDPARGMSRGKVLVVQGLQRLPAFLLL